MLNKMFLRGSFFFNSARQDKVLVRNIFFLRSQDHHHTLHIINSAQASSYFSNNKSAWRAFTGV